MLKKIAGVFQGISPDITPAQVKGLLLVIIPAGSKYLAGLGVYHISAAGQAQLTKALTGTTALAIIVIIADAIIRTGRNVANPGMLKAGISSTLDKVGPEFAHEAESLLPVLVTDAEEFASPPPIPVPDPAPPAPAPPVTS